MTKRKSTEWNSNDLEVEYSGAIKGKLVPEMEQFKDGGKEETFLNQLEHHIEEYFNENFVHKDNNNGVYEAFYIIAPRPLNEDFSNIISKLPSSTKLETRGKFKISIGWPLNNHNASGWPLDDRNASQYHYSRNDFNERIYVYDEEKIKEKNENKSSSENDSLLCEFTMTDIQNLYFCSSIHMESPKIGKQSLFVEKLRSIIRNFYICLLNSFLFLDNHSPIYNVYGSHLLQGVHKLKKAFPFKAKALKRAHGRGHDNYKNHIPIKHTIIDFFHFDENPLLCEELEIIKISTDPFMKVYGDDMPKENSFAYVKKKVKVLLKEVESGDDSGIFSANINVERLFIHRLRLLEFLFRTFLPYILPSSANFAELDLRGETVEKWLLWGRINHRARKIQHTNVKTAPYNPREPIKFYRRYLIPSIQTVKDDNNTKDKFKRWILKRDDKSNPIVFVKGGTFTMGPAPMNEGKRSQSIRVNVPSFAMSEQLVSQRWYKQIMGDTEFGKPNDDFIVDSVSWYDAVKFCNRLSDKEGLSRCYYEIYNKDDSQTRTVCSYGMNGYRLPTEAEWEYALKQEQLIIFGASDDEHLAERGVQTQKLGLRFPSYNIQEWCNDWYDENCYAQMHEEMKKEKVISLKAYYKPKGPSTGVKKVCRYITKDPQNNLGLNKFHSRVTSRLARSPYKRSESISFRVVRNVT